MSVDITIQETINEVDITVNQNVITVNVTRTTGSGGVTSVNGDTGDVVLTTDNVAEGSTNLYFTVARVRATILTGISFVSGAVITATDTVLSALGKLQKQVSSIDLPYVLKISDRIYQEPVPQSGTTYTFVVDDRWKDTLFYGTTDILLDDDADTFPLDSVLPFHVYDTTALFNFTALTDVRYLGTTASADIPIEVGDDCRLKKISTGVVIWELVISNKSTGGGSGTVTSVSGDTVDNTDPLNPVVETPNLTQVLAIDNKTNDIPIVSNNGKAVVYVNDDYTQIEYENNFVSFVPSDGIQLWSDTQVLTIAPEMTAIAGTINYTCPSFLFNGEEVATQPYADAKVANDLTASTTVAPSKTAVNTALDFTRRLITKGTGSVTGTVSETILTTLTIPANTLDSSCFIWTTMDFFKTNAGAVTARLYVNNANTLTGATLLGYSTLGSNRNVSFNRKFLVTGTSLDLLTANTAAAQVTNEFIENLYGASTVLTINPSADIFLIYTTQNDATGTVATNKMATVQKMKL